MSSAATSAVQITLADPTVDPALLLRNATARTKAVFRAGPGTFKTAKSAALKAMRKFRAGLTPI